jgi:hypothetical protein
MLEERAIELAAFLLQHAHFHRNTLAAEEVRSARCHWIGISHADYHSPDARNQHRLSTRRGSTGVVARLKSDIEGSPGAGGSGLSNGMNLSMRRSRFTVPAAAHHLSIVSDEHRADAGIWCSATLAFLC